jgi:hypothetical protein
VLVVADYPAVETLMPVFAWCVPLQAPLFPSPSRGPLSQPLPCSAPASSRKMDSTTLVRNAPSVSTVSAPAAGPSTLPQRDTYTYAQIQVSNH